MPGGSMSILHTSVVDAPIEFVFEWFSRPGAFTRLSPPWQPAQPLRESDSLAHGQAVLGLPAGLTWVAQHDPSAYSPPHRFADRISRDGLSSMPAAAVIRWRHEHEFIEVGPDRTRIVDRVETWLGSRVLRPMFVYRHRQLADDLAAHRWAASVGATPSTIAVTGASGLVGSALCAFLTTGGHRVIRLVRRDPRSADERRWDPQHPSPDLLEGVDAVVHLAGESIFGRFTDAHKGAIRSSRIEPTRLLANLAADAGIKVFVSASAIGFYGSDRGDEVLDEGSGEGEGFLAEAVAEWEAATARAAALGLRVANIRTGIVQSPRGGTLRRFRSLFAAGVGGPVAGRRQWTACVDIDALVDIYHRALFDDRVAGPVNAVAPHPVRNAEYAHTLARVLGRAAPFPVPALAPRVVLGHEGSTELAEASQNVQPAALQALGHQFRRSDLESSLRHQLGRNRTP